MEIGIDIGIGMEIGIGIGIGMEIGTPIAFDFNLIGLKQPFLQCIDTVCN